MTIDGTDNGEYLAKRSGGSAVKEITCYEGAGGNIKKTQAEAAADIISQYGYGPLMRLLEDGAAIDAKANAVAEAIKWANSRLNPPAPKKRKTAR